MGVVDKDIQINFIFVFNFGYKIVFRKGSVFHIFLW
jgi:hypothetical protein